MNGEKGKEEEKESPGLVKKDAEDEEVPVVINFRAIGADSGAFLLRYRAMATMPMSELDDEPMCRGLVRRIAVRDGWPYQIDQVISSPSRTGGPHAIASLSYVK